MIRFFTQDCNFFYSSFFIIINAFLPQRNPVPFGTRSFVPCCLFSLPVFSLSVSQCHCIIFFIVFYFAISQFNCVLCVLKCFIVVISSSVFFLTCKFCSTVRIRLPVLRSFNIPMSVFLYIRLFSLFLIYTTQYLFSLTRNDPKNWSSNKKDEKQEKLNCPLR